MVRFAETGEDFMSEIHVWHFHAQTKRHLSVFVCIPRSMSLKYSMKPSSSPQFLWLSLICQAKIQGLGPHCWDSQIAVVYEPASSVSSSFQRLWLEGYSDTSLITINIEPTIVCQYAIRYCVYEMSDLQFPMPSSSCCCCCCCCCRPKEHKYKLDDADWNLLETCLASQELRPFSNTSRHGRGNWVWNLEHHELMRRKCLSISITYLHK